MSCSAFLALFAPVPWIGSPFQCIALLTLARVRDSAWARCKASAVPPYPFYSHSISEIGSRSSEGALTRCFNPSPSLVPRFSSSSSSSPSTPASMPNNSPAPPTATLHAPTTLVGAHSALVTGPHRPHTRVRRRRQPSCRRATRARLASCSRRALANGGPCRRARAVHSISTSSRLTRQPRPPQAPRTTCWPPHLPQESLGSSSSIRSHHLISHRTRHRLPRHRARRG